ncbi:SH3 domain-containing protein [Edwardsiella ictaluri]|uniref:SH3b domain-containing protein n=2 Tax=Edwardsiella ictaluri TaxID=67780 RepID=C5BHG6_EDWI9|nr:TIGR04211 family SH3 domain-containing protein [Edwardsiella ictaluri]ACR67765.1 hypothetical protein NT01EI_0532 [Edwardsiella ictaluri 93-146]ARD40235.1 hypothetical protein B6E78_13390 [Edwardsiella ictaluri]AVZ81777.1 SH3 domain-containing protein [Edwardsiella ictaluri]EKS7763036.1 SH3 domain-containing protein [Edwardsiella ictaluri]EKS7768941.1 SH3 domain-containing protein [Edwardsiella ictaluri]
MHLFCRLLLPLLSLCLTFQSHAEEQRFISDALSTYVHSGPGNQYRISGTINAGDPVTLLDINQQSQFAQIRDAKGRSGWLPLDQLSNQPSLRTRVPALEAQLSALTAKLSHIDGEWQQKTAEMQSKVAGSDDAIARLQAENQQLRQQLSSAQKNLGALNSQLDDKKRAIILQWFLYGGGVAGAGLLLGLLLPRLLPRRRKERWMN